MKRFMLGALLALISSGLWAGPPEVDTAEVIRRGDMVRVVGEGPRGDIEDAIALITAPPADDSHKWFVSIITQNGCKPCEALKSDFSKAPELLAYIAAPEDAKAWAHFNVYRSEDTTQRARLKEYKVSGFPTLVIQTPRDESWGPEGTVVFQQTGYDGDPVKLAKKIDATLKAYARKVAPLGYPKSKSQISSRLLDRFDVVVGGSRQDIGATAPPFPMYQPLPVEANPTVIPPANVPLPPNNPLNPLQLPTLDVNTLVAGIVTAVAAILYSLFGSVLSGLFPGLILWLVLRLERKQAARKAAGQPLVIPEAVVQAFRREIEEALRKQQGNTPANPATIPPLTP